MSLPTTVKLLELSSAAEVMETIDPFVFAEVAFVPIVTLPADAADAVTDKISL